MVFDGSILEAILSADWSDDVDVTLEEDDEELVEDGETLAEDGESDYPSYLDFDYEGLEEAKRRVDWETIQFEEIGNCQRYNAALL